MPMFPEHVSETAHQLLPVAQEKEREDEEMIWCMNKMSYITQTSLTNETDSMAVCPSLDSDGKEGKL